MYSHKPYQVQATAADGSGWHVFSEWQFFSQADASAVALCMALDDHAGRAAVRVVDTDTGRLAQYR